MKLVEVVGKKRWITLQKISVKETKILAKCADMSVQCLKQFKKPFQLTILSKRMRTVICLNGRNHTELSLMQLLTAGNTFC
jgi:hypothetical protein